MSSQDTESDTDQFLDAKEHIFDEPNSFGEKCCIGDHPIPTFVDTKEPCIHPDAPETSYHKAQNSSSNIEGTNLNLDSMGERRNTESMLSELELEDRKTKALELKDQGNVLFKEGETSTALQRYTEALELCPLSYEKERSILFSNRSACHHKLEMIETALSDCDAALQLQPTYIKCLQRRATLREESDRLTEALEDYQNLLKLDPGNERARWACVTLPERIRIQQEEMKTKMLGQLKELGNMVLKPFGLSTDNFKVQKNPDSEGYSINFAR